jgi:hypothetical protein
MSHIRFNHVFFGLMVLAALSAITAPRVSARAQAQLQKLFIPVAKPMYAFGGWSHDRIVKPVLRDDASPDHPRDQQTLLRENTDLRGQVLTLTAELDRLKELTADRSKLGDLQSRCTVVDVAGRDAGQSESLLLAPGLKASLREDLPVLCPEGVVGKITSAGAGAARVRLITDKGNRITVSFVRFQNDNKGVLRMSNVSYPDCIAIGQGNGRMLVTHQRMSELKGALQPNDWAIVNDPDWSRVTYRVGRVASIEQQPGAAGFGQIWIESLVDFKLLREVMVVTK